MNLLFFIVGVATALIVAGIVYQWMGARSDRQRYAKDGRWIDIGRGAGFTWWKRDRATRPFCLKLE